MATQKLLIFFILCFIGVSVAQKSVGDACHHKNSDTPGTCLSMDSCSLAMDDLIMNQIRPQICWFEDTTPIVCCPPNGTTTTTPTTITTIRGTTIPTTTNQATTIKPPILRIGDKSIEKCEEYAEAVYALEPSMTLIGVKVDKCWYKVSSFILDGKSAKPREFPHMARIGYIDESGSKVFQCGGSLISENFVLTAGHCLAIKNFGEAKYVKLGDLDSSTELDDAGVQIIPIEEIIPYPHYRPPSLYHDIGLLKLSKPAIFTEFVRPICLNIQYENFNERTGVASGWGDTYWNIPSTHLEKFQLDLFTHKECTKKYQPSRKLKYGIRNLTQLCAGFKNGIVDTCFGEPGDPLQVQHHKLYCMQSQIGVASFGKACGNTRIPGVYTRVSYYIGWLEKNVWP